MTDPIIEVNKNAVSLVRTNYRCKGEMVVHVKQKYPWLYPYFYTFPISLWTSLQLENTSTITMNTDWKSLQIYNSYIFMDLKRPLNWLKNNKDRRKLKWNCKKFPNVKYIQISFKNCLILDLPVIGGNVS